MRCKRYIIISIIGIAILLLTVFFIRNINVVYKEKSSNKEIVVIIKKPDNSLSGLEGDKHRLLVYENKLFGKKILDERFLFKGNLLTTFNENNINIKCSDNYAEITVSGDKMVDKIYTCSWE
jgi:hypothetical protein